MWELEARTLESGAPANGVPEGGKDIFCGTDFF